MAVIRVDTFEDERLDVYARLTEVQLRNKLEPEKGIFIAESIKVVSRALDAGLVPQSMLMEEKWLDASEGIIDRVSPDVPIFVLPRGELKKLTGFELTRGLLATFTRPALPSVESLLVDARRVAVLEGIVDHTNIGAIFRSAAALGVDAVLVTPNCCDPLYRRSVRVSMGTIFQVPWTRIGTETEDWPQKGIARLRALGFQTASFALSDDAFDLDDRRIAACDRLAMVFGTEGDGLSSATIADCDFSVRIPMAGGVDSLNVAAASAVAFWQLCHSPNDSSVIESA